MKLTMLAVFLVNLFQLIYTKPYYAIRVISNDVVHRSTIFSFYLNGYSKTNKNYFINWIFDIWIHFLFDME